ncbi:hypothetical protein IPC962_29080 [Pseudomonas aeruginosa]|nr:hypothetical protein IPC962_29080 [Pseudomonas aeruginosa]
MRLLSKAGLAGSALWVVQLASSRHSVRVVNCLVIETPFDDGAHNGRPVAMPQQEILGNRGGDFSMTRQRVSEEGVRETD